MHLLVITVNVEGTINKIKKRTIALSFLFIIAILIFSYYSGFLRGKSSGFIEGKKEGFSKGVRYGWDKIAVEPVTDDLFLIFKKKKVQWSEIATNIDKVFKPFLEKSPPEIVGTFPVPGNYKGTDISKIIFDRKQITFPEEGDYYLRTTMGNFKILILEDEMEVEKEILSIASFVAKNSVHSKSDASIEMMKKHGATSCVLQNLLRKVFASDQPLCLHCGNITKFLNFLMSKSGYKTKEIYLKPEKGEVGHVVSEVLSTSSKRWLMIDTDYGAIVKDKESNWLSVKELAQVLKNDQLKDLQVMNIGSKKWLKNEYNLAVPFMSQFAWTIDKMSEKNTVISDEYVYMLKEHTYRYLEYEN